MNPLPNNLGQIVEPPKLDVINRFFSDPAFRAELRDETARERRRVQYEMDRFAIDNFKGDDEPGWLAVFRERVAAYEMGVGDE